MSKVKLYKYQEEAFNNTMEIYKSSNRACVIMATGTGKSYVMMRLLEEFDKEDGKAYILTPNNPTKEQTIEKMVEYGLNNAEFGLYQTINAMTDDEIAKIDCDLIIADELHRTGATQWGNKFEHLINTHPNAKVFGVTATPIRSDGRDMAEEYFEGNKACEISLSDAIVREILPMPLYISGLYTFDEEFSNMKKKIDGSRNSVEEKFELMETLKFAKQQLEKSNGVPEIIKKYITNYNGKYIVFCKNKTHMKKMKGTVKKWFKQADYNGKIFSYEYYSEDKDANENFNNFQNNNQEGLKLLFVIDMLNEGLHLKDINGCILLRTTGSHIVYYQQIGRVIDAGSKEQRVILDLVSNFNSLKSFNLKNELKESVRKRQLGNFSDCSKEFELDKFDVVDCVQECVDVFHNIDTKIIGIHNEWTSEEIELLKEKYLISTKKELICMFPRHPYICIKNKAREMELKKGKVPYKWDDASDELIYKYFPIEGRNVYKRFKDERVSAAMCTRRASVLGVKSETNATGKDFSEKEIKIMKKYFPIDGDDVYKRLDGRNKINVIQKMIKLGIRKPKNNKWEPWEKDIIINHYEDEGVEVVKRLPNRTKEQIRTMACRLGVKFNKKTSTGVKYVYLSKDGFYIVAIKGEYIGCYKTIEEAKDVIDSKIST